MCYLTKANNETNPSYNQAMRGEEKHLWQAAMQKEYDALIDNNVWTLVPWQKAIKSGWVNRKKYKSDGTLERCKSRIVARGNFQVPGVDYDDVFAPGARYSSVRTVLANGSKHMQEHPGEYDIDQWDVDTAFLYAKIEEEVYMEQPQGFEKFGPNGEKLVCKLRKSIYGLKQSPRNWNKELHNLMIEDGFVQSNADPCVYIKRCTSDATKPPLVVVIYVDDLIAGGMRKMREAFEKALLGRYKIKKLGRVHWCLGIEILFDIQPDEVKIEMNQTKYIRDLVVKYEMEGASTMSTPRVKDRVNDDNETCDLNDLLPEDNNYRNITGSVMYAALATRPDIAEAVSVLTRSMQKPTVRNLIAAKRVIRYLKGTSERGLLFSSKGNEDLVVYADADWAGDREGCRSTSGWVVMLQGAAVSWQSKLQTIVALSTTEAEYTCVSSAAQEIVYQRQLRQDMLIVVTEPTLLFNDNSGCVALAHNPVMHKRTKHLSIKQHYIRSQIVNKQIKLMFCRTAKMVADILTKATTKNIHIPLSDIMQGYKEDDNLKNK